MESLLVAGFLGLVQGVTEFLPISSTGHLVVLQQILGMDTARFGLAFNAAVHLGTLVALVGFFWREWWRLAEVAFGWLARKEVERREKKLLAAIVVGTVPAAVIGAVFEDFVARVLERPMVVAVSLILFSLVLVAAEKWGRKKRELGTVKIGDGFWVGLSQAIALIPGVSRSGATISTGMFLGMKREVAARFGFLLSVPIILGAGGKELLKVAMDGMGSGIWGFFLVGIVTSAVAGYVAIKWLLKFVEGHSLMGFVWYRILVGMGLLVSLLR